MRNDVISDATFTKNCVAFKADTIVMNEKTDANMNIDLCYRKWNFQQELFSRFSLFLLKYVLKYVISVIANTECFWQKPPSGFDLNAAVGSYSGTACDAKCPGNSAEKCGSGFPNVNLKGGVGWVVYPTEFGLWRSIK